MNPQNKNSQKGATKKSCLISFLVFCLICLVITFFLFRYIKKNAHKFVGPAAQKVVNEMANSTGLPDDLKSRLLKPLDKLNQKLENKEISLEEYMLALKKFSDDRPLLYSLVVEGSKNIINQDAKFTTQEKAIATKEINRFIKALYDEKISDEEFAGIAELVAETSPNGKTYVLKKQISKAQLKAICDHAKSRADAVGIADEIFPDLVKQRINKLVEKTELIK